MAILGNLYVKVQVMKRKLSILLLAASLLAFSDLPVLAEESQVSDLQETTVESSQVQEAGQAEKTFNYYVSQEDFDAATFPDGEVVVGSKGQIRPSQTSVLKDLQYAFKYEVSDSSILSIDAKGNWTALKEGTVDIVVRGWRYYNESPEFEAELDQHGIKRQIDSTGTTDIGFHVKQTVTVVKAGSNLKPVYRLYHPGLQVHLYTTDSNENTVLAARGWKQEGVAWSTRQTGDAPVYRMYHPGLKVHLYTKDLNEYQVLAKRGWMQEGVSYQSFGTIPVYRLYHPGIKKHLYTKDENEKNVLSKSGWTYEGIAWNVE